MHRFIRRVSGDDYSTLSLRTASVIGSDEYYCTAEYIQLMSASKMITLHTVLLSSIPSSNVAIKT
jgi:hypothetical protein